MQIKFSGTVQYKLSSLCNIPVTRGVYLIYDLRGTLYIGKAVNLQRRFEEHWRKSHNHKLNKAILSPVGQLNFSWILTNDPDLLEKSLITFIHPLCNKIQFKSYKEWL